MCEFDMSWAGLVSSNARSINVPVSFGGTDGNQCSQFLKKVLVLFRSEKFSECRKGEHRLNAERASQPKTGIAWPDEECFE